ncbi:NADPH-dependent glutamate synthase [Treponema sp. OttesenSCG-928-L16]|nr:NADPH-dependent glutamate synthase [Treponema sp. OttesenSCG-928-L16]
MMPNMSLEKNEMPVQDPHTRVTNFNEVALGYTKDQALDEAERCLVCKNKPCVSQCPVNIDIPAFIKKTRDGDFEGAYQEIAKYSCLPAICGRVCPQETQCEGKCVRGVKGDPVGIGRLERFVADWHLSNSMKKTQEPVSNGHRVAVVGSGPAGLSCAGELAMRGYAVTVYEALHKAGGVLVYGIPEFRLPKAIVQKEIDGLKELGVSINTDIVIGKTITVDELFENKNFEAVFIGSGAGLPMFMNIPGENYNGVYSANEFLTRINLMKAYEADSSTPIQRGKKVAVVGGGNVAMDAARCAKRLGADVTVIYRRTDKELPARAEEVEHAKEEGIVFKFLTNPVKIGAYNNPDNARDPRNGWVHSITCVEMELGEPDASGRRRPIAKPGSEFEFETDCVIMALGTSPNPLIHNTTPGLDTQKWGGIIADEKGKTSRSNVWAGGDAVTGSATVILAMGAGKTAAQEIDSYLSGKSANA